MGMTDRRLSTKKTRRDSRGIWVKQKKKANPIL
jgi:hypothetical protein